MVCETIEDRWWWTMDHLGIAVVDLLVSDSDVVVVGDRGERFQVERRTFEAGMREIETDRECARNALRALSLSSQIRAIKRFGKKV